MANELKQVYGSATTVISIGATLANAANTVAADATQLDNSTLNYPYAMAVLNINDTFAAAPTAGSTIDLYMTRDDIDGTTDETPVPAATDILYLAKYVGSFVIDNQDVATVKAINISLLGVQKARFFMLNNTGQTISFTSVNTTVKVTPFSFVPT
jgi:hypothetical protein